MRKFKNRETGEIIILLAQGCYKKHADFESIIVYCPDDKENTIFVMNVLEFAEKFEEVAELTTNEASQKTHGQDACCASLIK